MSSAASKKNDTTQYRSLATGLLLSGPPGLNMAGMVPVASGAQVAPAPTTDRDSTAIQMRPLLANTKFKYSRLNLTINQHGEYDTAPGAPIVHVHRPISLFWLEKLSVLLFYLQIHALIWLQCYDFYPQNWRAYWRWTLIFILDVHNLIKDAGGSNTGGDTAFHSLMMLVIPIVSFGIYEYIRRTVYADRVAGSVAEDTHRVSYLTFQKWSLLYAEQLYIPVILVWFRVWTCDSADSITYIYKNYQCWTGAHAAMIVVISIVSLFFMFAFPLVLYNRMKRIIVFSDPQTHERYLQSRELEYIMGCNNMYEYTYFFYLGSFKRPWAWQKLVELVQKVLLCLFLISLNGYNAGNNGLLPQSILFLFIISGPTAMNVFYRTYRCPSTNYFKAILDAVLFFTVVMNVIEADPNGFSSSFLDQYTFSDMMLFVNLVGLGIAIILAGYCFVQERKPIHHGRDIYWPTKDSDLVALNLSHPEMITSLNVGKRLLEESLVVPEEFYPRQNLLDAIHTMRTLLAEAKARREGKHQSRRSVLDERAGRRPSNRQLTREEEKELIRTIHLGEEKSRALEWTLQDMVEDLALLYNTITARVKAASGGGIDGSGGHGESNKEQARLDRMQAAFQGFSADLSEKQTDRCLMHPMKRMFLAKMLVVKGLVAAGNESFVYGERPPWAKPEYLPPLPTEEELEAARLSAIQLQQQQQLAQQSPSSPAQPASPSLFPPHSPAPIGHHANNPSVAMSILPSSHDSADVADWQQE